MKNKEWVKRVRERRGKGENERSAADGVYLFSLSYGSVDAVLAFWCAPGPESVS